ncbi:MAG: hypothetical protein JXQ27_13895 [Acidobacteria bacterium]|nr:hypothetical protein [Acidobacteriota bacterium]
MANTRTEWQTVWQQQAASPGAAATAADGAGLLVRLRAFEEGQRRINRLKTAALLLLLGSILSLFLRHATITVSGGIGLALILGGSLVFLWIYWRHQFRLADLDLAAPPPRLIPQAIARLNLQRRLFAVCFPLLGVTLMAGLNLLYVDWLVEYTPGQRWLFHGGMTLLLGGAFWAGRRIRGRKYNREYAPLIAELETVLKDLKNEH